MKNKVLFDLTMEVRSRQELPQILGHVDHEQGLTSGEAWRGWWEEHFAQERYRKTCPERTRLANIDACTHPPTKLDREHCFDFFELSFISFFVVFFLCCSFFLEWCGGCGCPGSVVVVVAFAFPLVVVRFRWHVWKKVRSKDNHQHHQRSTGGLPPTKGGKGKDHQQRSQGQRPPPPWWWSSWIACLVEEVALFWVQQLFVHLCHDIRGSTHTFLLLEVSMLAPCQYEVFGCVEVPASNNQRSCPSSPIVAAWLRRSEYRRAAGFPSTGGAPPSPVAVTAFECGLSIFSSYGIRAALQTEGTREGFLIGLWRGWDGAWAGWGVVGLGRGRRGGRSGRAQA